MYGMLMLSDEEIAKIGKLTSKNDVTSAIKQQL